MALSRLALFAASIFLAAALSQPGCFHSATKFAPELRLTQIGQRVPLHFSQQLLASEATQLAPYLAHPVLAAGAAADVEENPGAGAGASLAAWAALFRAATSCMSFIVRANAASRAALSHRLSFSSTYSVVSVTTLTLVRHPSRFSTQCAQSAEPSFWRPGIQYVLPMFLGVPNLAACSKLYLLHCLLSLNVTVVWFNSTASE